MLEKQQMEQKYIDNAALQQEEPALTTGYRDRNYNGYHWLKHSMESAQCTTIIWN